MLINWLVKKYILLLNLEGLVEKNNKYNFRCPICGDSKINSRKKRGWILIDDEKAVFYCHNCNEKMNFQGLLWRMNPELSREYKQEMLREGFGRTIQNEKVKVQEIKKVVEDSVLQKLDLAVSNYDAVKYCKQRMFPDEFVKTLFYSENYIKFLNDNKIKPFKFIPQEDKRIIVPFYNKQKELIYIQGRTIQDNEIKYLTNTIIDGVDKIWGLDKIDYNSDIFILEGVFDACFIPNAIATAGVSTDIDVILKHINKEKIIFVPDNDYRTNAEVRKKIMQYINGDMRVVLWPKDLKYKDINEMVMNGLKQDKMLDFLYKNTYNGIVAKTRLNLHKYK